MSRQFFLRQMLFVVFSTLVVVLCTVTFEPVELTHTLLHDYSAFELYELGDVLLGLSFAFFFVLANWIWQLKKNYVAELSIKKLRKEYQTLLESLPIAVAKLDAEKQIEIANPTLNLFKKKIGDVALGETVENLLGRLESAGDSRIAEFKRCYSETKSGQYIVIDWCLHLKTDNGYLLHGRDVSEYESSQHKLTIAQRILNNTPSGVVVVGKDRGIEYVNQSFERITGYKKYEILGKSPSILKSGRHGPEFYSSMFQSLTNEGRWQGEIWNRRKNGDVYLEWLSITLLRNAQGEVTHQIGMFSEITAQENIRERLHTLAYYDALTSLVNRTLFNDRLEGLIKNRSDKNLCVIFIDLDGFKRINDSLGHQIGDQLLATFANRLKRNTRSADVVARWGGDEFIIAIEVSDSYRGISTFCNKQLKVLETPFMLSGRELNVTASLGVSVYGEDAQNASELIRNADIAMYQAKRRGKNRFEIFSAELHTEISERIEIENRLRLAIMNRQVGVHFQPQVSSDNKNVVGLEALARWTDSELGAVSPQKFISVAEDTGLIGELSVLIIYRAFEQFKQWHEDNPDLTLSVNLSASQLQNDELIPFLQETIGTLGINPNQIKLEITEDIFMSDIAKSIQTTARLKEIVFQISLDDFGTGYSSLSYLKDFYIDELKIDRSFVESIDTSERNRAIASAIVVMSEILGIDCIVEGVETEPQLLELQKLGCSLFQGYLFHKPMPAAEIVPALQGNVVVSS